MNLKSLLPLSFLMAALPFTLTFSSGYVFSYPLLGFGLFFLIFLFLEEKSMVEILILLDLVFLLLSGFLNAFFLYPFFIVFFCLLFSYRSFFFKKKKLSRILAMISVFLSFFALPALLMQWYFGKPSVSWILTPLTLLSGILTLFPSEDENYRQIC